MPSATVTKILKSGNEIRVQFGKRERVYDDIQQMRNFVRDTLDRDTLEAIAMALMLSRQPALGNPSVFEGKSINIDLSVANWGTLG